MEELFNLLNNKDQGLLVRTFLNAIKKPAIAYEVEKDNRPTTFAVAKERARQVKKSSQVKYGMAGTHGESAKLGNNLVASSNLDIQDDRSGVTAISSILSLADRLEKLSINLVALQEAAVARHAGAGTGAVSGGAKHETKDKIQYEIPHIEDRRPPPKLIRGSIKQKSKLRIPTRIAQPLMPFPKELCNYICTGSLDSLTGIQEVKVSVIITLRTAITSYYLGTTGDITIPILTSIDDIVTLRKKTFGRRFVTKSRVSRKIENTAKNREEINLLTMQKEYEKNTTVSPPIIPSLIYFFQRVKSLIAISERNPIRDINEFQVTTKDIHAALTERNEIIAEAKSEKENYIYFSNQSYFFIYDLIENTLYLGDMEHLDYVISMTEIIFNLEIIKSCREYTELDHALNLIVELIDVPYPHNQKVNIMKSFEPLCLMRSDLIDAEVVSWLPIVSTIEEFYRIDNKSSSNYQQIILQKMRLYLGLNPVTLRSSWEDRMLRELANISGTGLQELSAVYKFIYYAEIDSYKGLDKYLTRVHTPRPYNPDKIELLTCQAKRNFTLNFTKANKLTPTIIYPADKKLIITNLLRETNQSTLRNMHLQ
ncbi:hypothetical protein [Parasitella parasitica]|uniref:Uncharacterized protein n=1 Tax=Parasitella parasitica TaxID=35722 RepID=A0A0B7NTZ8_9FUNG|nr:hypothetical protein [Parasitella parasitica]